MTDLLIRGGVVTTDPARRAIEDGAVAVAGGRVAAEALEAAQAGTGAMPDRAGFRPPLAEPAAIRGAPRR